MRRSGPLKRRTPLKRWRPKRRTSLERERSALWRERVLNMPGHVVTSSTEPYPRTYADVAAHHVILQQVLRRRARELELPPHVLVWDPRVGMKVSRRRHERHHARIEPIRRDELPEAVWSFVADYGLGEWMTRHYPA